MKKNNNKGFLLTELLVTATLISTVLIFLYLQFYNVKKSYENSFKYNTVSNLFALDGIRSFLIDGGYIDTYIDMVCDGQILSSPYYYEITVSELDSNSSYFSNLLSMSNVYKLYFVNEDLTSLQTYLNTNTTTEQLAGNAGFEKFRRFINYIDYEEEDVTETCLQKKYRLVAQFNDDTFATLLVGGE